MSYQQHLGAIALIAIDLDRFHTHCERVVRSNVGIGFQVSDDGSNAWRGSDPEGGIESCPHTVVIGRAQNLGPCCSTLVSSTKATSTRAVAILERLRRHWRAHGSRTRDHGRQRAGAHPSPPHHENPTSTCMYTMVDNLVQYIQYTVYGMLC